MALRGTSSAPSEAATAIPDLWWLKRRLVPQGRWPSACQVRNPKVRPLPPGQSSTTTGRLLCDSLDVIQHINSRPSPRSVCTFGKAGFIRASRRPDTGEISFLGTTWRVEPMRFNDDRMTRPDRTERRDARNEPGGSRPAPSSCERPSRVVQRGWGFGQEVPT